MKPILLHYYITNRCNARCSFCTIWQENPKVDARLKDVIVNLSHAKKQGCTFVDFTGGEPLLHPDLPQFLAEAKKLKLITSVTTNCLLFEKRAKEIAGYVDLLHFSLDGDCAQVHDAFRGVKSFDAVMTSVEIAKGLGLAPDLLFTYNNNNIGSVAGTIALAQSHKLMLILDPEFSAEGEVDPVSIATHARAQSLAHKRGVYLNTAHLRLRKQGGNSVLAPICKAVSSTIVVMPDNRIALPCYHHRTEFIEGGIASLHQEIPTKIRNLAQNNQGKYPFCEGCHINCYFDPSYHLHSNAMAFLSLRAKLKYAFDKYVVYGHRFGR